MRPATVRQCAVLIGGTDNPTPLLTCGDRPFLAWLLREFLRFGVDDFVLLTGHPPETMKAALPAITANLPKPVRITCCAEPAHAGTGGALHHARHALAERFWLCNGASLMDFNFAHLLSDAISDPDDVAGRCLVRRLEGSGTINAGIYLFNRSILNDIEPVCSLERDVMPRLAARGALRGTAGDGYFIDIGIPADLQRAQTELPARLHRRALFLDRDGVINHDHGYVGTRERFDWMPGARETIRAATDAGFHVFIVTNQSGIARGHYNEAQFAALSAWMTDEIRAAGGTVDDLRYCPHHPEAPVEAYRQVSDWRKPAPGMLLDLIEKGEVDPARSLLIGDQPTDLAAAASAGMPAYHFQGDDLASFALPLLAAHAR